MCGNERADSAAFRFAVCPAVSHSVGSRSLSMSWEMVGWGEADVPGVMTDKDDISSIISTMTIAETRALIKEEVIYGGMIPKVQCCVAALAQGVRAAHIIDGRQPHSLLTEVMSEQGSGTMIVG